MSGADVVDRAPRAGVRCRRLVVSFAPDEPDRDHRDPSCGVMQ